MFLLPTYSIEVSLTRADLNPNLVFKEESFLKSTTFILWRRLVRRRFCYRNATFQIYSSTNILLCVSQHGNSAGDIDNNTAQRHTEWIKSSGWMVEEVQSTCMGQVLRRGRGGRTDPLRIRPEQQWAIYAIIFVYLPPCLQHGLALTVASWESQYLLIAHAMASHSNECLPASIRHRMEHNI